MPRIANTEDLVRVHILVFKEDWEKWKALFGDTLGPSKAMRIVLRDYLKRLEAEVENAK